MVKKLLVWIIIDHKTGNANQAIALAKALGEEYQTKMLRYNFLGILPNRFKFNSLMGVDLKKSSAIEAPYPDIVISSGRKTAVVSNYIKKLNPNSFIVHLMNPDLPFDDFDLICLPSHDFTEAYTKCNNIAYTTGSPSYLDELKVKEEGNKLETKLNLKPPFVAVMIGGKTKEGNYTVEELRWLLSKASKLANDINGSLLITTSRRTDPNISNKLIEAIDAPYLFYDWHEQQAQDNPYLGFLSLAEYFIVTGESVSTCSEVLATGKPLYIYYKEKILYKKHRKFLNNLFDLGYIRYFTNKLSKLDKWNYKPLREAEKVSQIIREKLQC